MVVLILEKVPVGLRGELSRWMIEPRRGVFVGSVSGMVRDKLWEMAVRGARGGGAMLLWSSPTEQGFQTRIFGDTTRDLVDFEGLTLVHVPGGPADKRKKAAREKAVRSAEAAKEKEPVQETGN